MDGTESLLLSLLLLASSIALFSRCWRSRTSAVAVSLASLALLCLSLAHLVADYFTGAGIDESVLFHLRYGLQGAGFAEYSYLMAGAGLSLVAALGLSYGIFRVLWRRQARGCRAARLCSLALLAGALGLHPAGRDLVALQVLARAPDDAQAIETPALYAVPELEAVPARKNLVFLYLESVERTYLDEDIFPGLTPNLRALEREARHFTDIREAYGMAWTIAGITASQCGTPLHTPSGGNSMRGVDHFLPGARCLGDLLADVGFRLDFLGGAALEFAGKGSFFRTHGFDSVQGRDELLPLVDDPAYQSAWGLYDDSLFELAQERFESLSAADEPFGLFLLNLDTHHPKGHVSESCRDVRYRDGGNPILNAVHCTDRLVREFVDAIRRGPGGDDTLIVIASDHLALENTASNLLRRSDRRNLFMVLDPDLPQGVASDRTATPLDIAPTVLSMLGYPVGGLGFGRDLLADAPTLMEGRDLNPFLARQRRFLASLWGFPQLDEGMYIDPARRIVRLGTRTVRFPVIFVLDEGARVKSLRFEFASPRKLIDDIDDKVPPEQPFIWIDACAKVSALSLRPLEGSEWCVAMGRLGARELWARPLHEGMMVGRGEVEREVEGAVLDDAVYRRRLASVAAHRTVDLRRVSFDSRTTLAGDAMLQSAGSPSLLSSVQTYHKESSAYVDGPGMARGLTLYGFGPDGAAVKLAHRDTCDPANPVTDGAYDFEGSFRDVIEEAGDDYGAHAIVAHDSAVCAEYDMAPLFEGLPLEDWKTLRMRQPYIALLAGNGEAKEFVGAAETSLRVETKAFITPRSP